jgi:hypothetical protein
MNQRKLYKKYINITVIQHKNKNILIQNKIKFKINYILSFH